MATTAYIPKIDPVISELRFGFVSQLLNIWGANADVIDIANAAAFLADFVVGEHEDDDELEVEVTLDNDDDDGGTGAGAIRDLFSD
jgi:hypothetical protein